MATEKALFTSKQDFQTPNLQNLEINPYLYHDGDNFIIDNDDTFEYGNGTPTNVAGKKGNAMKMNGSNALYSNVGVPASGKYMVSFWVKPTANDISSTNAWKTLASNRGHGWANQGVHVAIYNQDSSGGVGTLDVRIYGIFSVDMYSSQGVFGRGDFNFTADTWNHICVVYDQNATDYPVKAYVDGELILFTSSDPDPTAGWSNSFTIGDMLSSSGASQYPFEGTFDEVIFAYGEDVWTKTNLQSYLDGINNKSFYDYWTKTGTIRLPQLSNGDHVVGVRSWYAPTIDLGEPFDAYGKIQAIGQITSESTSIEIYTRSSDEGVTWDAWQLVGQDGYIYSQQKRYLEVRADLQTQYSAETPVLEEIQVLDYTAKQKYVLSREPLVLYRDQVNGLDSFGELRNAYDIIIEEKINGEEILTFKLPHNDPKRNDIGDEPVEMLAYLADHRYILKETVDKRDNDGTLYTEFKGEALWYELHDWYAENIEEVEVTAYEALQAIFNNIFRETGDPQIDWVIGRVFPDDQELRNKRRTLRTDFDNVLALIRSVQETWGGEIQFDVVDKQVHLLGDIGEDSGVRFYYNKNLKNIERTIDTYELVTRIYPQGKGDLDITTVNKGVTFLENMEWVNKLNLRRKIRPHKMKDERYTIPENLKEDANTILNEKSKPIFNYKIQVFDLSTLSGHEHETYGLGDTVTTIEEELFNEEITSRIVRRKLNVRKPENTEVELSQPQKTLADIQSRAIDDRVQTLAESDPLSATDVQQMTVFNNLLNSRADDGINGDWVEVGTGFDIANSGFSGDWSFKVTPNFDEENSLTQIVEGVSHRSSYTVSAAVVTEGEITRGGSENAFVGIKVLVYYEGETEPEVHELLVPDVTNE